MVAAQRTRDSPSEDGSRNLLDAIRVAANPVASGFGAIVVVNQVIHPAREVKKALGSGRVDTWQSGRDTGAIGAGVAVVSSTRGWGGRVSGNASRLGADNLTPEKARILLMLALTVTNKPDELQRIFNEY